MKIIEGEGVVTTTSGLAPSTRKDRATFAAAHAQYSPELTATIHTDRPGPRLQLFTAKGFEWVHVGLPIPNLPAELDGFRILHLSDLHARRVWDPAYDDLIARVRATPPDVIAFTGDFVDDKHDSRRELPIVQKLINALTSRLGFVTVLGNHDGDLLGPPLASLNVTLIDHRSFALHSGSATLELIGLPGVDRADYDPTFLHSLGKKNPNTIRIALAHYPDLIRRIRFLEADVYLAGHTHGGQVCFPGKVPILRHDSLPTKFIGGINRYHDTWLVVNRGLGFSSYPIRLFCPAEVLEITLKTVK